MRILVFSDSHKDTESCSFIIDKIAGVDVVLHAGDHISDASFLKIKYPQIKFYSVPGNCDFSSESPDLSLCLEGKKIFMSHGHFYNVKSEQNYDSFLKKAIEAESDLAIFGHTHNPFYLNNGHLILLNPGSIKNRGTFGVVEIYDGKIKADICDSSSWFWFLLILHKFAHFEAILSNKIKS